ncbi:MAG: GEVED domain-containing protein [Planctomycetota bacterium]|jgi:hypothetical protein
MIKLWKLAAIVAILIGGQALGQGDIAFTLELGGNNNGANPPITFPAFTPGDDANGQTFSDVITWDVVAELSDSGDTIVVNGIANVVFDLEVRETTGGTLVDVSFFSTVMNGSQTGREQHNAAFCSVFNLAGNGSTGGRVFDDCYNGGPYMDRVEYPSSAVFPAGVVGVLPGELVGMGCGYSKYEPAGMFFLYHNLFYYDCDDPFAPGGPNTAGVGRIWEPEGAWGEGTEPVFDFWPGLHLTSNGSGGARTLLDPISEGQIDMGSLPNGEYSITLVAGNCNVLMNDQDPEQFLTGDFAVPADSVAGDVITFWWDGADLIDWGDAPDSYQTVLASNGPSHIILPAPNNPFLGPVGDDPDDEPDAHAPLDGSGDDVTDANDDEDGVSIPPLTVGVPVNITFEVNGPGGWVDGWIDFNGNGIFDPGPPELVVSADYTGLAGIKNVAVTAPAGSDLNSPTYARFRIATIGPMQPFGPAADGEVEDHHPVEILPGGCTVAPAIEWAESVKIHNGIEWGIDMLPTNSESRLGGVTQIRVNFDIDVDLTAASAAVTAGNGSVTGFTKPATDEMLIDLAGAVHPVPGNGFCLIVQLDGIACDNPGPAQPSGILNGALLKIRVFKGDADYDKFTGFNDYVKVKSVLAKNSTQPEFLPQCDVDVDGFIGFNDYVGVKSNLAKSVPDCP